MSRISREINEVKEINNHLDIDKILHNKKLCAIKKVVDGYGLDILNPKEIEKQEKKDKVYKLAAKTQTVGVFTKELQNNEIRVSINCVDFLKHNRITQNGNIHFVLTKNEEGNYWIARPFNEE